MEAMEARLASMEALLGRGLEAHGFSATTGQDDAVFSWEQALTAAFPEAARPFETDMHGGFNEDRATGVVYTGIPGYGLCSISPDLRTRTKLGSDPRLLANIHGLVVFEVGTL